MRPPSLHRIVLAPAIFVLSLAACASRKGHIQARDTDLRAFLDLRLDKFESVNRPFGAVIASVLIKADSPRIMREDEWPRKPSPPPLMTVRVAGVTVRQVVEEALSKDGHFAPFEVNGFLVLAPPHVFRDFQNPLNFIVDHVSFENVSPLMFLNLINAKLKAADLKPLCCVGSDLIGGLEEDVTLKARGKTVRWLLVEIAKQRGVAISINITGNDVIIVKGSEFKARKLLNYFDNPFGKKEE